MLQPQAMRSSREFVGRLSSLRPRRKRHMEQTYGSYGQWVEREILLCSKGEMWGLYMKSQSIKFEEKYHPLLQLPPLGPTCSSPMLLFPFTSPIKIILIFISLKYPYPPPKKSPLTFISEFTFFEKKLNHVSAAWAGLYLILRVWATHTSSQEPDMPLRCQRAKGASDKA